MAMYAMSTCKLSSEEGARGVSDSERRSDRERSGSPLSRRAPRRPSCTESELTPNASTNGSSGVKAEGRSSEDGAIRNGTIVEHGTRSGNASPASSTSPLTAPTPPTDPGSDECPQNPDEGDLGDIPDLIKVPQHDGRKSSTRARQSATRARRGSTRISPYSRHRTGRRTAAGAAFATATGYSTAGSKQVFVLPNITTQATTAPAFSSLPTHRAAFPDPDTSSDFGTVEVQQRPSSADSRAPPFASAFAAPPRSVSRSLPSTTSASPEAAAVASADTPFLGICVVCKEDASGKHFGVLSCEACKSFFRRSVRRHSDRGYQCPRQGQCKVETSRRTTCQACRYQKCIAAGMQPELVQDPRCPVRPGSNIRGQGHPHLHGMDVAPQWRATAAPTHAYDNGHQPNIRIIPAPAAVPERHSSTPPPPPLTSARAAVAAAPRPPDMRAVGVARTAPASAVPISGATLCRAEAALCALESIRHTQMGLELLDNIVKVDDNQRQVNAPKSGHLEIKYVCDAAQLQALFRDELAAIVKWAHGVPQFRNFDFADQIKILSASWHDLLVFRVADFSQPCMDHMVVVQGKGIRRLTPLQDQNIICPLLSELAGLADDLSLQAIIPAQKLRLCKLEKACFEGMLLLNPDRHLSDGSAEKSYIRLAQYHEALLNELHDMCEGREPLISPSAPAPTAHSAVLQNFMQLLTKLQSVSVSLAGFLKRQLSEFGDADQFNAFLAGVLYGIRACDNGGVHSAYTTPSPTAAFQVTPAFPLPPQTQRSLGYQRQQQQQHQHQQQEEADGNEDENEDIDVMT